jgi:iron(II)-dependent oxidoreductase
MTPPNPLGQLSHLQQLTRLLVEQADDATYRAQFESELSPLGWYLGRAVFLESYWLRVQVLDEPPLPEDLVRLYQEGGTPAAARGAALPPRAALLDWARTQQDDNLMRLANPSSLPPHPLLERQFLPYFLIQNYCLLYEQMLMVLTQQALGKANQDHRVGQRLHSASPLTEAREVPRGHYRVGGAENPIALDLELPPQAVELSAFRIARRPVSNGEFLGFIEAGGYTDATHWHEDGRRWLQQAAPMAPQHWRRDPQGEWFAVGVNGPYDLAAEAPVQGLNRHEAAAYAAWAGAVEPRLLGARLPHEFQWEVACRLGYLADLWQTREWCGNPFEPYAGFRPLPAGNDSEQSFAGQPGTLRGGSIHSQPPLRRASFRYGAPPSTRHHFSGLRLVWAPA